MQPQQVPDLIAAERANPPADTHEAALRLAQILRNIDLLLPNHVWNYSEVLYAIADREKLANRRERTLAWNYARDGSLLPYIGLGFIDSEEKADTAYHKCGTIGCALGIARMLWGYDTVDAFFPDATGEVRWNRVFYEHNGDTSPEGIAQRLEDAVS